MLLYFACVSTCSLGGGVELPHQQLLLFVVCTCSDCRSFFPTFAIDNSKTHQQMMLFALSPTASFAGAINMLAELEDGTFVLLIETKHTTVAVGCVSQRHRPMLAVRFAAVVLQMALVSPWTR